MTDRLSGLFRKNISGTCVSRRLPSCCKMRAIREKERGGYMRGFEKHRLTKNERKVVIGVAIFMALLWLLWIILIIQQLPVPSQGVF